MKIEIWSDVSCPYCYIGKRLFESSLANFSHRNQIDVIWKSFLLDEEMKNEPQSDLYDYLAKKKGESREWSIRVHEGLVHSAEMLGLTYNFDRAIPANSFDAHRLIQMAKTFDIGDAAEEALFSAYFTEGKNIADFETLAELGESISLDRDKVREMLENGSFTQEVHDDIKEAIGLYINAVPTFVFNRKYTIIGAKPAVYFTQALEKSFYEWQQMYQVI